jgi:predicted 2-oxoglutarate/Fe(II)-dependent dioxygenase YbiX
LFEGDRKGIPILTVLAGLNNDYEGGELIMFKDTQIKMNTGDVVIFPSNFLYPHKVNPVTKGVRYSCVSWAW